MKRKLLSYFVLAALLLGSLSAQQQSKTISFEHFANSRGDFEGGAVLEIPYSEVVMLNNPLNTSSGFGMTLNFHGNVLVVDYMEILPNGTTQVILRREDGKDFYGFRPTLKAILVKNEVADISTNR